ncbi:hypothetical protein Pelo_2558 [Pelomyxa schiedti]|nr:hypothetical protein Pelo_2558 [Pelomyxa schiedti]
MPRGQKARFQSNKRAARNATSTSTSARPGASSAKPLASPSPQGKLRGGSRDTPEGISATERAKMLILQNKEDEAMPLLREGAAKGCAEAHLWLGRRYCRKVVGADGSAETPEWPRAVQEFRRVGSFEAYRELGDVATQLGDWPNAIDAYRRALPLSQRHTDAYAVERAVCLFLSTIAYYPEKAQNRPVIQDLLALCEAVGSESKSPNAILHIICGIVLLDGKNLHLSTVERFSQRALQLSLHTEENLRVETRPTIQLCITTISRVVSDQNRVITFLLAHHRRCGKNCAGLRTLPACLMQDIVAILWASHLPGIQKGGMSIEATGTTTLFRDSEQLLTA